MGVQTEISLERLNLLFPSYSFTSLVPTKDGIIDTTYIVANNTTTYILKKYEREIKDKVEKNSKLLSKLYKNSLNVPLFLAESQGWYLYTKLEGSQPKHIQIYHLHSLARFMLKLHQTTSYKDCHHSFISQKILKIHLEYLKRNYYFYYKKFQSIKNYKEGCNTLIHGDIFRDNTLFEGRKIAVFDFIDAGCGSVSFDIAVALLSFKRKRVTHYFIDSFLKVYNQKNRRKIAREDIEESINVAIAFYTLLRIYKYKNIRRVKELL